MAIKPEEITSVIQKQLEGFEGKLELSEVGYVLSAGDGIARIYGLKKALAGELLELPNNVYGMVMNLETDTVGCVLFGEDRLIKEGDSVKRTGKVMEVPVGDAMMGRVVNPLGQPIDGKGPLALRCPKCNDLDPMLLPAIAGWITSRITLPWMPGLTTGAGE